MCGVLPSPRHRKKRKEVDVPKTKTFEFKINFISVISVLFWNKNQARFFFFRIWPTTGGGRNISETGSSTLFPLKWEGVSGWSPVSCPASAVKG
jgi:hypothetical protein